MRIFPLIALLCATPVAAHEFWIEPQTYTIEPSDQIRADIKVGQEFSGAASAYLPRSFVRFDMVQNGQTVPVTGRTGDNPAAQMAAPGDGLVTLVYESGALTLKYTEFHKFENFVKHKDLGDTLQQHVARNLRDLTFSEEYIRYAKALVAIGSGAGSDSVVGLRTEIVAEANPYTDDISGGFPVRVLLDGQPRADVQIELFAKAPGGATTITLHRTDAEGRAVLPVSPGMEYLVDAVAMEPIDNSPAQGPVWRSLWASLVFQTPG